MCVCVCVCVYDLLLGATCKQVHVLLEENLYFFHVQLPPIAPNIFFCL